MVMLFIKKEKIGGGIDFELRFCYFDLMFVWYLDKILSLEERLVRFISLGIIKI